MTVIGMLCFLALAGIVLFSAWALVCFLLWLACEACERGWRLMRTRVTCPRAAAVACALLSGLAGFVAWCWYMDHKTGVAVVWMVTMAAWLCASLLAWRCSKESAPCS